MKPLFLAGPTGVGKSTVALHLARMIDGEIISVDSMQVYRQMDVGTAKPSAAERAFVPHHLIDVVDVTQWFDVAQFIHLATQAHAAIESRGRVPIYCGGTGLYFRALLRGLAPAPSADLKTRSELEQVPLPVLLAELEAKDKVAFGRIDRANKRRVIRALEVLRLTCRPFSEQQADWAEPGTRARQVPPSKQPIFVYLERAAEDLHRRIDARVDQMFASGLVAETQALLNEGLAQNPTALQALGYRQVVDFLHGGISLPETIQLVKQRTRQYAKRQRTWFRKEERVQWLALAPDEAPETVADRVAGQYGQSSRGR